jgi:hypothetical protein
LIDHIAHVLSNDDKHILVQEEVKSLPGKTTYVLLKRSSHQIKTITKQVKMNLLLVDIETNIRTSGIVHQEVPNRKMQHLNGLA